MHTHARTHLTTLNTTFLKALTRRALLLIVTFCLSSNVKAQFAKSDESISTSIYTILVNTTWENPNFSTFTIGVVDPDTSLYSLLKSKYNGLSLRGKPVIVKHFLSLESIEPTQVLCLDKKFNRKIEKVWSAISPTGTLLITNSSGKSKYNMVDFNGRLNRKDFKVNRENIEAAKMKLSEKFVDFSEGNGNWEAMLQESTVKLEVAQQKAELSQKTIRSQQKALNTKNMSIEQKIVLLDTQSGLLEQQAAQLIEQEEEIKKQEAMVRDQLLKIKEQKAVLSDQLEQIGMQKVVLSLFIVVIALIVSVAYIIYRSYNNKRISLKKLNEQNKIVVEQKEQIEKILIELTASIRYAHRIQNAVLPSEQLIRKSIPGDYFVLYNPKDIVSGDFFFVDHRNDWTLVAVADCTGHGVPGAFVSMLCISLLNEIVKQQETLKANVILNELRDRVISSLQQRGIPGEQMDGMDISLLLINVKTRKCQWSGANNPLYVVSKNELTELKPDKRPISIYPDMQGFTNHEIEIKKDDVLYLFTDGYADQFGGSKGKKFMSRNFKNLIMEHSHKPMEEQNRIFSTTMNDWKNCNGVEYEQIDDITLLGIRIH